MAADAEQKEGNMGGMPYCSPAVLNAFAAVCWTATLLGGYTYGGLEHSGGVLFWYAVYWGTSTWMKLAGPYYQQELEGYPLWSYFGAILNGGLVMPLCLAAACHAGVGGGASSPFADDFLLSRVAIGTPRSFWIAQGNAALCAQLLKDFQVFDKGFEVHFAAHHAVSIFGLVLCLALPVGAATGFVNAVLAELGTQCYNYYVLSGFSAPSKVLYFAGMQLSHALVVPLALALWGQHDTPLWMRALYMFFCGLLILLRTVGWCMYAQKELSAGTSRKGKEGKAN